jgi:prevent-host-death family protein
MEILNISEAKARLSSVIEKVVTTGEECLIGKAGKAVAKIVRYEAARKPRRLGLLKGKIRLSKDWDTWPDDIATSLGIKDE